MRAAVTLLLAALALPAAADEPKIPHSVARVKPASIATLGKADGPLIVGDWRPYVINDHNGPVVWEVDPIPELGFDSGGKPYLLNGDVGLHQVTKPLTSFRPADNALEIVEVPAGNVIVWGREPGKVRLTARGIVNDLPARVATIIIEVQGARPPPDTGPIEPVPPPSPVTKLYFAIILPDDRPQTPQFLKAMDLPAWDEIRNAGHDFKPMTAARARELNIPVPKQLPAVQPLIVNGDESTPIPPPLAMPYTDADVRKLLEVKP